MKKYKYDIVWHEFPKQPTIVPIEIREEVIMPGCTLPVIVFSDYTGERRIGSPDNYYDTPEDAFEEVVSQVSSMILNAETQIAALKAAKKKYVASYKALSLASCMKRGSYDHS